MKFLFCVSCLVMLHLSALSAYPIAPPAARVHSTPASPDPVLALRITAMRSYSGMTVHQYEQRMGHRLNLFQKAAFRLSQKHVKSLLHRYDYGDVTVLQKISWLLRGFVFGPLAILAAYIFLKDDYRELIKWTWIGFAAQLVTLGILLLVFL